MTMNILLNSINDVKTFVNVVSRYDFDVDLISERYVVDAKSIMGIFSLDLSKPIKVDIHAEDCQSFVDEIKIFEV
ncbi:MAG: HPr family phosphocarrier protein [Clostridia bacterium]|nr:HPr family phosphocarrier protein [Clostridia bacterium]